MVKYRPVRCCKSGFTRYRSSLLFCYCSAGVPTATLVCSLVAYFSGGVLPTGHHTAILLVTTPCFVYPNDFYLNRTRSPHPDRPTSPLGQTRRYRFQRRPMHKPSHCPNPAGSSGGDDGASDSPALHYRPPLTRPESWSEGEWRVKIRRPRGQALNLLDPIAQDQLCETR